MIVHAKGFPKCIAFEAVIGRSRAFLFCNNSATFFFLCHYIIQRAMSQTINVLVELQLQWGW